MIKDLKIFLRDVSQWSQLLLLLALVLLYLYNFSVLDLQRMQSISGFIKNVYAFVNLGMAGFVMATVAVRFVFPAVSAEGAAFWIIRTSPISLRDFLWSKFWTGLVPVLVLTEVLTITANEFLGVDPLLKVMAALAIVFMSFALVGLAIGLGARYPQVRRRPEPGGRLVRRRRVHDAGGAVRHRDDRAARMAGVTVSAPSGARRPPVHHDAAAADAGEPRGGHWPQHLRLARVHALGRASSRADGRMTIA